MKSQANEPSLREAVLLNYRAAKDIARFCPKLFPYLAAHSVLSGVSPYVPIFFTARILNEIATLRRAEVLWRWIIAAVIVNVLISALTQFLLRRREVQVEMCWQRFDRVYMEKFFSMDYADVDKQATHDLFAQIQQNADFQGWGFYRVTFLVPRFIREGAGIVSAVALTVSLFSARVPDSGGWLTILNHPLAGLAAAVALFGVTWLGGAANKRGETNWYKISDLGSMTNRILAAFAKLGKDRDGAGDIRMYRQEKLALHYIRTNNAFYAGEAIDRLLMTDVGVYTALSQAISGLFTGCAYAFACLKALGGAFPIGSVTQYVATITAFSRNVTQMFEYVGQLTANASFLKTTYQFLDIPNAMYQGTLPTEKRTDREYDVEFRDVSFKYPGSDAWALKHLNVRFKIGQRYAVVGENGSGKTTFIKLLCRLYDPQEGEILLNGIDIKKYNYREYMDLFSVVFQDFQLLSQPLGDNVAGSRDYDAARVGQALADAGFGERLDSLPEGLNTQLYRDFGEDGVEISGGEAQKIAIARALYRNAPFLILDEPTAALDPIAEAEIYAQLDQITGDRTAIYISHRLSSCRFCDEILVFDHGQIVQRGAHEVLVNDEAGKYHALWHAQAQYYQAN